MSAIALVKNDAVAASENLQARLIDAPLTGLYACSLEDANRWLVAWKHKLGPCARPFDSMCHVLEIDGAPQAVTVAASTVSDHVVDNNGRRYDRQELVELARCAAATPWLNRVVLRLWRELCAPLWRHWPVTAAISYSHDGMHTGNLYRFDGWEVWQRKCGSSGGGSYSRKRYATEAVYGPKTLWGWRYQEIA